MTPSNLEAALPPAYPLHDKASDPLLSNFSFMGDTLDSVNDPIKWSNSELVSWLCAFENGKHKMFVKTFEESQLDGKDICFLPYTSFCAIVPTTSTRTQELYDDLRTVRKNAEVEKEILLLYLKKQQENTDGGETLNGSFPALLSVPSLNSSLFLGVFVLIVFFSLTSYRSEVETFLDVEIGVVVKYGSIPLISAIFTYVHIWLALYMTFFPLEFIGCCQIKGTNVGFPLGWQGIIPFKAEKMARLAVRLMTEQLIDVKEEFSKIDVDRVASEMDSVVFEKLRAVIDHTFSKYQGSMWAMLPQDVRDELVMKGSEAGPTVIARIMSEVKEDILSVFDIEEFVVSFMTKNKKLLNKVFIQCGWDELCFIRDCGALLGGFFGFIQMLIWIPFHPDTEEVFLHPTWQSLAVFLGFGLIVGSATNWLALKIIFEPIEPISLGCYSLQGLFLKRQKQISEVYGEITANEVLSAKNIIREMLEGSNSGKLKELIRKHLERGCDDFIGTAVRPIVRAAIGNTLDVMRDEAVESIMRDIPETMLAVEDYTQEALDMKNTLSNRMSALPSAQFERLLHPVFEEDEWKLVLMGGVLGVAIGALQAFFIN